MQLRHIAQAAPLAAVLAFAAVPASGAIVISEGYCGGSCTHHSVGFSPAVSGTTVVGNTNPPPVYDVTVRSLDNPLVTLHANGSNIDTGGGGPGFNAIEIYPEAPYAWSYIEFMMDSKQKLTAPSPGLTITAYNQFNVAFTVNLNFPWEGDQGTNQHYQAEASGGDFITKLVISYTDPLAACGLNDNRDCNRIHDIHNIDLNYVNLNEVPEPASALLFGLGLAGLGLVARRRAAA